MEMPVKEKVEGALGALKGAIDLDEDVTTFK